MVSYRVMTDKVCKFVAILSILDICCANNEGYILSPGYPNPYMKNAAGWYKTIVTPEDTIIELTIYEMSLPQGDSLNIKDGDSYFSKEIAHFDSNVNPTALPFMEFSTQNIVPLALERYRGGGKFKIRYRAYPKRMGTVPYLEGNIVSPNYPHFDYRRKEKCRWTLMAAKGQVVKFRLVDLGIKRSKNCDDSALKITGLDRNKFDSGQKEMCGKIEDQRVKQFQTVSSELDVTFDVNLWFYESTDKGFWLVYEVLGCKAYDLQIREEPTPRLLNPADYYYYGYLAKFACPRGYTFQSGVKELPFVCHNNRTWTGTKDRCTEIICGDPGRPAGSSFTMTNEDKFESVVTYSCNNETTLVGSKSRVCGEDGRWSGATPICQGAKIKECGDPGDPAHGHKVKGNDTHLKSTYPFGSIIRYACDVGYNLTAGGTRTCLTNGTWDDQHTECDVVRCSSYLRPPLNGSVIIPDITEYGAIGQYRCDHGFELTNGNEARLCRSDGTWSGKAPFCRKLTCSRPQSPRHGNMKLHFLTINEGAMAVFTCNTGYIIRGQNTTVCADDGTWTNPTPICEAISCYDLVNRTYEHVSVKALQGQRFGSTARFVCDEGYYFDADMKTTKQVILCLDNKMWSQNITGCPFKKKAPNVSKQVGEDEKPLGMYIGIAVAGAALLVIFAVVSAYLVRKRNEGAPVDRENNFDNPMYNVNAKGSGQVVMGEGWSKNPTYKDMERAAANRESNYGDLSRDSAYEVYGNVSQANPSVGGLSEVTEEQDS